MTEIKKLKGKNGSREPHKPKAPVPFKMLNMSPGAGGPMGPARTQPNPPTPKKGTSRRPPPRGTTKQKDGRYIQEGISAQKYNEMAAAYWTNQTISYVARTCKVTAPTAKKYIEIGDLARGMRPIKGRYQAAMMKVEKAIDESHAASMKRYRGPIGVAKGALTRWAKNLMDNVGARAADPNDPNSTSMQGAMDRLVAFMDADPERALGMMDRLIRMDSFTLGGPDARTEVIDQPFQDWTWEDKVEFIRTGRRPDRLSPILSGRAGKISE